MDDEIDTIKELCGKIDPVAGNDDVWLKIKDKFLLLSALPDSSASQINLRSLTPSVFKFPSISLPNTTCNSWHCLGVKDRRRRRE